MNYHVGRAGQQLGVFSLDEIRAKLASGEFRAGDLGWTEGMADWRPLAEIVPGVQPSFTVPPQPPASSRSSSSHVPGPARQFGPKPANNLVGAILVTIFCCLPFGIPAIIYAAQVDGKYNAGDQAGAEESAAKAKKWMWISLGVGLVGTIVYVALMGLGFASGTAGGY